jgi:UDP-glucose 4-epimerase
MRTLVLGGAGYIGSHVIRALEGEILVYDNLSTGHAEILNDVNLVIGDLGDTTYLKEVMSDFSPDAVIHLASSIDVGESTKLPMKYYRNNLINSIHVVEAMKELGIDNLIFSSSAAVYGNIDKIATEDDPVRPINPYAVSKAVFERILRDSGLKYVALRYFNAAGADPLGRTGEMHDQETHLIPRVIHGILSDGIRVYGTDYPTPDGTCIRDYVHVCDIANVHVLAMKYLLNGGQSEIFNVGYGSGYSVKQIIEMVFDVTNQSTVVVCDPRRSGDPAMLVASPAKIMRVLGWKPQYADIRQIISDAWRWEVKRYGT